MTKRSSKIGPTGRLGARYGVKVRRRIRDIEKDIRAWHTCPECKAKSVRRESTGIWLCRRCGAKIASSAYTLSPPRAVRKEMAQVLEEEHVTPEEIGQLASGDISEEEFEEDLEQKDTSSEE